MITLTESEKTLLLEAYDNIDEGIEALEHEELILHPDMDEADFAQDYFEQSGLLTGVSDYVQQYIDYDRVGHDLIAGGDISAFEAGVIEWI